MSKSILPFDLKKRRRARRYAVQAIYQWQLANQSYEMIEDQFITRHADEGVEWDYFKQLVTGVMHEVVAIDQQLSTAIDRPLDELTPVELAVVRLAVYELMYESAVPYKVVIDEALELTKKYGSAEGATFVNGVLDKLAHALNPDIP
jgi:N utilization substance protein B